MLLVKAQWCAFTNMLVHKQHDPHSEAGAAAVFCSACRILQSESEALACEDSVVLDLPQLLDLRIGQAVALR
jgi:hypothetical protein